MPEQEPRYFSFKQFLKRQFGEIVWKIPVHLPFTCPNRDGTTGLGGCIYCRNEAFSPNLGLKDLTVTAQIQRGIQQVQSKKNVQKFLVYFQSYSNTYADVSQLKSYYDQAVQFKEVVGLAIGTRPDCISGAKLDLIESYASKVDVWLEYGLQSIHDQTLARINRGHKFVDFLAAVDATRSRNIKICVHVIIGLPGENAEMILMTAGLLASLPIHGIKIHPLQVHRETVLEQMFLRQEISLMTLEEYVQIVCDFLELLPPTMVIQRLTADAPRDLLVAPRWCENKMVVLKAVETEFIRRNSRQGIKFYH